MNPIDSVLFREMPVIYKIIQDETWLEGERRGCQVQPHDTVVQENVCRVILRIGQQLRESIEEQLRSSVIEEKRAVTALLPMGDEAA